MHELQEAAIENFQDIPVQVHGWHWSEVSPFPVVNCQTTYLTFPLPSSDKGSDRPLRENPVMSSYEKCVVIPFHSSGDWKRLKPIATPETISYKARRAQDGEMELGEGDGQPEYKDSTERMQDLAEEEAGEGETASQRTVGTPTLMSFSSFKSKFEPYEKGGMVMKREEYNHLPWYECPLRLYCCPDSRLSYKVLIHRRQAAQSTDQELHHELKAGITICTVAETTRPLTSSIFFENWGVEGRFHSEKCRRSTAWQCKRGSHNHP